MNIKDTKWISRRDFLLGATLTSTANVLAACLPAGQGSKQLVSSSYLAGSNAAGDTDFEIETAMFQIPNPKVDQVWETALELVPEGQSIYEWNKPELVSNSDKYSCISVAWYFEAADENEELNYSSALERAINSDQLESGGYSYVIIPNIGRDWMLSREVLVGSDGGPGTELKNKIIILEQGVVISATPDAYLRPSGKKDKVTALFKVRRVENVILHGQQAGEGRRPRIVMFPAQERDPRYGNRESWNNQRDLAGCRPGIRLTHPNFGVTIRHFDILRCGGDGIYVNTGGGKSVIIDDMIVSENLRNGLSIIEMSGDITGWFKIRFTLLIYRQKSI